MCIERQIFFEISTLLTCKTTKKGKKITKEIFCDFLTLFWNIPTLDYRYIVILFIISYGIVWPVLFIFLGKIDEIFFKGSRDLDIFWKKQRALQEFFFHRYIIYIFSKIEHDPHDKSKYDVIHTYMVVFVVVSSSFRTLGYRS